LHTILHRTDLIVFPLTLQTITTAPMMSIWGKGGGSKHQATYQDAVAPVNHNSKWDSLTSLVHQLLNVWTDKEKTNSFHQRSYFHQPTTRWQQPTTAACSSNLSVFGTQSHDFPASVHPPTWTAHCAGYVQIAPTCHSNPTHKHTVSTYAPLACYSKTGHWLKFYVPLNTK